uniref:CUB domain-containing protein n=1 Tax=Romanomermis culicivorax TaxID=13658 RepID=A0A915JRJ0_ROMCU
YGGDFDTAQGIITSPWYRDPYRTFAALPIAHLTNETDQRQLNDGIWWRIRLPDQDSYAQLTFEDLRLDDSLGNLFFDSSCSQKVARLEIYDGYCLYERSEQECTLSKTLCGVGTNFVWTSVFNTASIRLLYVEGTTYRSDFKVQWDSVPSPRDEAIEPHAVCQHDRLVVRQQQPDPFSGGSPFSVDRFFMPFGRTPARFCGFKKPEGIENPSIWRRNFPVTVEFVTDQSVNFSGFSLQYKLVCGAHFQLKDGTTQQLTSPNYPNAYPLSTKCVWIIGGRNGRTLSVQFDEIQLESSDGCRKDNLKVINGYEGSDPVLAKYCGSPSNKPLVTSTSNFLYIEFVSDDSGVGKGFSLTVSEKRFGCDERVLTLKEQNPKATLESPNFPDEYPNSLDCSWVVQAPPGHRIQFDLDPASFDLEMTRNGSCSYDYIELHDGASMVAPLLGQFCDKTSHGSVFSTGSNMLIRFVTDESIAKKGFRAIFKIATCGGTVLLKVGTVTEISSPNYPQPYSSNNICEWKVLAPEGHFINVSFADIGLMSTPNSNCTSDYVEVVDVNATGTSFGRFCKPSDSMIKIRSTSDSLYIKFVSDPHMNTHGFKILLNASEEVCGGHLTESSGIITSPMYPAPYPNKRRCRWHIDAPPGSIIKLTVEDLHMPENEMGDCRYDGLKIHDGSYAAAPEIDTYCGTRVPNESVYSSSDAMTIAFYSDISMNGRGFKASYVFVPDQGCGNLIQNSTKVVVQFTNKTRMYCHWKIVRPMTANSSVTLKFKNFQMHDSPKCAVARMTIFAEFMDDKQHDKTIHCGKEGNFTKTFYQPPNSECGGILTEPGTIINPGSSMKYEDNIDCPWLIVAPKGRLIETIFRKFHIEYQLNCLYDHLSLKSGPYASSTDIKTLCGDHSMVTENKTVSATGYMYILFHSDHSRSTGGFAIDYRFLDEACGSIQQGEDGLIQSPMYPLDYSNDQFCQWEVIVNNGFRVAIVFETFDIQISDNCSKDSLLIEHWRLAKTKARVTWDLLGGPYCGYQKPEPLTSDTNHPTNIALLRIKITAICGFSYSDESGTITSPYFPSPYKSNISCQYFVKPKLNVNNSTFYTVFQFEDFQLEDMIRGDCVDYLEITEVENNNTVAKLCGNELPETLSAKGPVLLTFASDSSSEFRGFRLNYKMSECGGQIFLNEEPGNRRAKIQTPTYPAKYQNNMECEWIISTAPDKIIDFEFTNMSIESHADCRYDFVELRDGSDVNATLMGKFCGFDLPIVRFKSTSNKLYIRFYADLSISSLLGFQGIASPTYGRVKFFQATTSIANFSPI